MDQYQQGFREESKELLSELETALIELEAAPDDKDAVERVFRALHTVKGNSRVVGFDEIGAFVHRLESVFDRIRRGLLEFNSTLGNLTLAAMDHVRTMIESHFEGDPPDSTVTESILSLVEAYAPEGTQTRQAEKGNEVFKAIEKLKSRLADWAALPDDIGLISEFGDRFATLRQKIEPMAADLGEFSGQFALAFSNLARMGKAVDSAIPALATEALDHIEKSFGEALNGPNLETLDPESIMASMERPMKLLAKLQEIAPCSPPASNANDQASKSSASQSGTYRIKLHPNADFFRNEGNPLPIFEDLSTLGEFRILAQVGAVPPLETIDPEKTYLFWEMILTTTRDESAVHDPFIFMDGQGEYKVESITGLPDSEQPVPIPKLGQILVDRGDIPASALQEILQQKKPIGEELVARNLVPPSQVASALAEQNVGKALRATRQAAETNSALRVSLPKLDRLVNLIGEMVTVQARLAEASQRRKDADLIFVSEEMGRLTERLRESYMQIRMQQIGITFYKFNRMVKELAQQLGKQVEVSTEGAQVELDKATIERLNDPLVHLIRNCVDHGIESPERRQAAGKSPIGKVHLIAEHSAGYVLIKVCDDGGGLNAELIRSKAVEKGLIAADAKLSEQEMYALIFMPGFSTAKVVSDVSGRGSGLDVVQKAIDDLHGTITISSVIGKGTTFTFKLPLTLAIIDGLLVSVGERLFVFPLGAIRECVENRGTSYGEQSGGRGLAEVRGELLPFLTLREEFHISDGMGLGELMVVLQSGGSRLGVVVDQVIGLHQTVIKPLGRAYQSAKAFSGATILGDGNVALVLDPEQLMTMAGNTSTHEFAS